MYSPCRTREHRAGRDTNQQMTSTCLLTRQDGYTAAGVGDPTFNAARPNNAGRFSDIYVIRPQLNSFYNALIVQYRHSSATGFSL